MVFLWSKYDGYDEYDQEEKSPTSIVFSFYKCGDNSYVVDGWFFLAIEGEQYAYMNSHVGGGGRHSYVGGAPMWKGHLCVLGTHMWREHSHVEGTFTCGMS